MENVLIHIVQSITTLNQDTMKTKIVTLTLTAFFLFAGFQSAFAQKNIIKINPLSLGLLTLNMQYERAINNKMSGQLGVYYTGLKVNVDGDKVGYSGIGVTPEFRYYATNKKKDAPRGFFVGPFFRYQNWNVTTNVDNGSGDTSEEGTFQSYRGGFILGHQWVFGDVFSLEFFGGPSIGTSNTSGNIDDEDIRGPGFTGIGLRGGMSLGVAF